MAIIVLTLVIPLLGLALLYCDAERQQAPLIPLFYSNSFWGRWYTTLAHPFGLSPVSSEDHRTESGIPQTRSFWALCVRASGAIAIVIGLLIAAVSFLLITEISYPSQAFAIPLLLGIGLVTLLTGWQALRLPRSWPSDQEDPNAPEIIEQYFPLSPMSDPAACRLRSGAWVMVLFPLLYVLPILGVVGAFLLVIAAMVLSTLQQSRRAFQSQLLWLITIAVRNKLPLAEELRNLSVNKGVKRSKALQLAAQDLEHGDTLSMALERNRLLPASTLSAIRVSEGGSHYEEALRRLAIHSTERMKTYSLSRLSEIFIQVITLFSALTTIVGFLMYFIIPKFREIFLGFGVELPKSTQVLINLSDNIYSASSAVVFWIGIGMAWFCWQALRYIVGWSSLPFPAVMYWFPKRDAPEILRAVASIASDQTSLPQQMLLLIDRRGRPDLGARYRRISESLSRGEPLSQSLYSEGVLTTLQKEAVAAGERGGHLSFVLFSLADAIEQRENRRSAYWAEMLRPMAVVTCGLITGFIVFAMFVPLIKLLNELSEVPLS